MLGPIHLKKSDNSALSSKNEEARSGILPPGRSYASSNIKLNLENGLDGDNNFHKTGDKLSNLKMSFGKYLSSPSK